MTSVLPVQGATLRPLRPHQEEAITGLRDAVRAGHTRVVLQMATGAGKTLTSAHMIVTSLSKGHRAMFCVPRISLIDQTVTAFEAEGIADIGVIQAKHPRENLAATVQVASVQTLQRRLNNLLRDGFVMPRLVIVDECHEGFALIERMIADFPQTIFVGLSATPWAKGMGKHWGSLVVAATTERLVREGYLSKFTVFAPYVPFLGDVGVSRGDYIEAELEKVMGDAKIVGNVVQTWLEKGEDRPSLLFGVNCKHAKDLQRQFLSHGVSAGYCDAYTDVQERKVWEERFRSGDVKVMCSVRTLTTGIDWPVSCILDCAPTKSEMLHVQRIGRGLRINPGTEDCLVLDFAGNSLSLGLVTDIHHEGLDAGETKKGTAQERAKKLPKPCPACGALHTGLICSACGNELKPGRGGVQEVDGELVEFKSQRVGKDDEARSELDRPQVFWSMALWLDRERGRGGKLAKGLYKGKFGVWPRGVLDYPQEPSRAFMNYEKSRRIAYAKSMAKKQAFA